MQMRGDRVAFWLRRAVALTALAAMVGLFVCPAGAIEVVDQEKCIGCGRCLKMCPQWQFKIPEELAKIDAYVESLLLTEVDYRRKRK